MHNETEYVELLLRGQYEPEGGAKHIGAEGGREALEKAVAEDVRLIKYPIICVNSGPITFLDADTHHWQSLPSNAELEAYVAALRHQADCSWVTHGRGLRLVFIGGNHRDRAVAAALELPPSFEIEFKKDTRHPKGAHPDRPGTRCGEVHWNDVVDDGQPVNWGTAGRLAPGSRDALLKAHGYEHGERYDHSRCPIAGQDSSGAKGCVIVLDDVIFCHRCAAKKVFLSGGLAPGVFPIGLLGGDAEAQTVLNRLAKHFVHWAHARLDLKAIHPNLSEAVLRSAYDRALKATHLPGDPRIARVFDRFLGVIATTGAWLDVDTFAVFKITNDTADALPACQIAEQDDHGEWSTRVSTPVRERAKNGFLLEGYRPVRVVRGFSVQDQPGRITVQQQPLGEPPVRLLPDKDTMPREELEKTLNRSFPGIDLDALVGIVAGAFCAEKTGMPAVIHLTGPTGSGKGATAYLAAKLLGSRRSDLRLEADEEEWRREVGTALLSGQRVLFLDEIARIPRLGTRMRRLLELSSEFQFRLLYQSSDSSARFEAVLVLASLTVPEIFATSPEICRRIWVKRLPRKVPEWRETSGARGIEGWRSQSKETVRAANTIVTEAYRLAAEQGFLFDRIAPQLGFHKPDEGGDYVDEQAHVDLYRHCRGEYGQRRMHTEGRYGSGGWVDGNSTDAQAILNRIEPKSEQDAGARKDRHFHLQRNLEALSWNDILGIDQPAIVFEIRTYGSLVAMRFREDGKPKGEERRNEELPPPGGTEPPSGTDGDGPGGGTPAHPSNAGSQIGEETGSGADTTDLLRYDSASTISKTGHKALTQNTLGRGVEPICSIWQGNQYFSKAGKDGGLNSKERRETGKPYHIDRNGRPQVPRRDAAKGYANRRSDRSPVTSPHNGARTEQNGTTTPLEAWPKRHLALDFETYFDTDYSLKKLTIPEYVHNPRFHVHGVAVRWPDGKTEFRADVKALLAEITERYGENWNSVVTVAFNGQFDGFILHYIYGITPAFWMDPMTMARQVLPGRSTYSLRSLAEVLGLPPKGDELEALKGVRNPDPKQLAALHRYAINDVEITYALLEKLLSDLSRPEVELRLMDQCIRLFTERGFSVDHDEVGQLRAAMEAEVDEKCAATGQSRETISSDTNFASELQKALSATGRIVPAKQDKNGKQILAFSKNDPSYETLQGDADPRVRGLARARALVQSMPAFQRRVERFERIARATSGRLPVYLNYHGAHTGRYSGGGGTNLQNLAKRVEGIAGNIAACLHAEEGCLLVGADASQIEARILAQLAEEARLLEAFREGRDVYCEFASQVFGEEVRPPKDEDPLEVATRLETLRHIGKRSILGLGYGMGSETFERKLREDAEARPLFEAGELNTARIKELVYDQYRRTYRTIPELWRGLEEAFTEALLYGVGECGTITFRKHGSEIHAVLPSERSLRYPDADQDAEGKLVYQSSKRLWGGKLTENLVQALARDYICEIMLRAEEAGYPVLLQIHDEIILHIPEEDVADALEFLTTSLKTPPDWLPGLPVDGQGWVRRTLGEGGEP